MSATVAVPLVNGGETLIDAADLPLIGGYTWRRSTEGYVCRSTHRGGRGSAVTIYLHREVARAPRGMDVDHVNRDRLDNRRDNLRICTRGQNLQNQAGRPDATSKHRGVSMHKSGKWRADVKLNGKQHYLGLFEDEQEAAAAAAAKRAELMTHTTEAA